MIEQLRVKLENRPGKLEAMVSALAAAGVDLKALEVSERGGGEYGQAHLIVDDLEKATAALEETQHEYEVIRALVVEMDDRVGGLASILSVLAREKIGIRQLYAFVSRVEGKSLAVMAVADLPRASELLTKAGVRLFSQQAINGQRRSPLDDSTLGDHLGLDYIW